ncbi:DNA-binding protein [Streptomyces sp. NPDC102467]|uniref:DNA-binding protein n=1 Tax=Streptomyces sp. NPDC102467 TaxID=3366179 RepID=UPI0037F32D32
MKQPTRPTLSEIRNQWPPTVPVTEAAMALGCGRSWLYEAIKRGDSPVKTIPVGKRCVVVTADLVRLLSGEDQAA